MTVELAPTSAGALTTTDGELTPSAAQLIAESLSPNTRRAYTRWLARWDRWCAETGRTPLPGTAESLASFVALLADEGKSASSIGQAIGAIRSAHDLAGYPDAPGKGQASKALRAHKRRQTTSGRRPRKAAPLTVDKLREVVDDLDPARTIDIRDRALLLVGFAACLRRSALVALDVADVTVHRDRVSVLVRHDKTDQEGNGRSVDLPFGSDEVVCPVRALEAWMAELYDAGHLDGPLFRPVDKGGRIGSGRLTDHSVSRVVARRAVGAELTSWATEGPGDRRTVDQFTGHSLRAGGATSMAAAQATTAEIAEHGGWSPRSAVVHEYVRVHEAWRRNPMRNVL